MKINKIKEMSSPELEKELGELKSELFKLKFSLATNGLDNPMRIKEVNDERILFDNGNMITYDHEQDCCEWNYAKFEDLEPLAFNVDFDEEYVYIKFVGKPLAIYQKKEKGIYIPKRGLW